MRQVVRLVCTAVVSALLSTSTDAVQDEKKDLATGEGLMVLHVEGQGSENVVFEPRYGYAYASGADARRQIWLLLTDAVPANADWMKAVDRGEALRRWSESSKAPFVLVELDAEGTPQLLTQSAGDGGLAIEMVSVINGLPSIQVSLEINDGSRLRGRLQGGVGSCGEMVYCERTKDYYFDVTISQ